MVLLDDIVQVTARAHQDVFPAVLLATEPAQTQMTRFMAVERDLPRPPRCAGPDCFPEESHGCSDFTPDLEQRVDRLPLFVDRAVQVSGLRTGVDVCLVDPPGGAGRLRPAVPPLLVFGDLPKDPPHDGGMRHVYLALLHQRHEVAIAQAVGEIPANAGFDHITREPPATVNCITFNWLGHGPAPGKSRQ